MYRQATASLRPSARSALVRRQFAHKPVRRSYATSPSEISAPQSASSHVAAGVAGGALVLLGGYGYYHFSGAKTAVKTVTDMTKNAKDLKDKAVNATPSPKAILGFVRSAAHSYAGAFPGAGHLVDSTFDQIDQIAEKNGPEVEKIVKQIYGQVSDAASKGGDNLSENIMNAIQEGVSQIQKLSSQLGAGALAPLLASHPALKSALGDTLGQLNEFSGKYGEEAKKVAEDAINQIKKLTDQGVNGETIAKAAALARQKLKEVQDLGAKASSDAYSKAVEGARPYLEKTPDVQKYLEESIGGLKEYVGDDGVKLINDTYTEIEAAGKKGDTKQLMKIAREKIEKLQKLASEKGSQIASKATEKAGQATGLDQLPGMDKLFESVPNLKDIHQLRQLAQERGGEFEKLLNETYEEMKSVLENKAKKAKDLGGKAAGEAKDTVTK